MESYGNEKQIQQGEDWNLDLLLSASNREYIPYIVSSERTNPYFAITVASTKFEKNKRYAKTWWCPVDAERFYQTTPLNIGVIPTKIVEDHNELGTISFVKTQREFTSINDAINSDLTDQYDDSASNRHIFDVIVRFISGQGTAFRKHIDILYDYRSGTKEAILLNMPKETSVIGEYEPNTNINYLLQYTLESEEGLPYHYCYVGANGEYNDNYELHVRQNFLSNETAKWGAQNYMYQITLVSGQTLSDRLDEIYNTYKPKEWPNTIEDRYNFVKIMYPTELEPDIEFDSPLGTLEVPEPILRPTKLEVFNNLKIKI